MKILCLLGSPRPEGNSTAIAKRFCETAKRLGAEIQVFSLNKLKFRGCQACMTCKTDLDKCVLKDDLTEILDAIYEANVLILATPVYVGDVSSQLKGFIDRTYSYYLPDFRTNPNPSRLPAGKKLVFIQTQGKSDESFFDDIFPRYEYFFKRHGFNDNHLIRACGVVDKGEADSRRDIMKLADEIAEKVTGE